MHNSRVQPKLVDTKRLDPDYYHPQHLADEELLRKFGADVVGRAGKLFAGPFGSKLPSSLYLDEGVPLFRVGNVGSMEIDLHEMAYLDEAIHSELSASEVRSGDLLIVKASVGEKICKVPASMSRANITQHIIALRPNNSVDTDYLAAFLFGTYGRRQLIRRSLGSIIQYLGVTDTRTVLYPKIENDAQAYIGEKVRQAERLREHARVLERESLDFFNLPDWTGERVGARRSYRNKPSDLRTGRLDAPHYDPAHLHLAEVLKSRGAVPLSRIATPVKDQWDRRSEEFFYLEIGGIDLGSGSVTATRMRTKDAPSRAQKFVKPWDVLVSTVRPNRKNVTLVPELIPALPIVASTGFAVLRFPTKEAAVFYQSWLRSDAATQQLMQWNAGGAYPAIDDSVPISTLVPVFGDHVVTQRGHQWLLKITGSKLAVELTVAAKLLVEALIEGRVEEAELIEAQEELERGYIAADRALLSRLTRKGVDMMGESPLIPDLDDLYQTLEQVATPDTQGQEA
jgi:type I restriction enzyme S subunit